jgi:NADP-dependent 3-hydroxy acid dehydrogenase YdfG
MVRVFPVIKQVLKLDCLKNKTAIITGGATGLGKKMAEHYAANKF